MGRRTGRRDRRAQRRAAVEALVRAGWSEGEVRVLLELAEADGLDAEQVADRLLEEEERLLREWEWDDEEEDEEDGGWLPALPLQWRHG